MTIRVPYLSEETIERDAETLLAEYAYARGVLLKPPIPIEDIVEKHLKLRIEFDNLHHLLGVPQEGLEPDIFGAIWVDRREICIDQSLDPEEWPNIEGRYRFTLAHEGGHWRLHRAYLASDPNQASLFADHAQPAVVCRSSQSKERVEWQADFYASCQLMPRALVVEAWQERFGNANPRILRRKNRMRVDGIDDPDMRGAVEMFERNQDDQALQDFVTPFAERFKVSPIAMRIRLEKLGLLHREIPRQKRLVGLARRISCRGGRQVPTERITAKRSEGVAGARPSAVYETRDFYLACFLRCLGYELLDLRPEGRRRVFVFRDRHARRDDVMAFYGDGAAVPPLAFSSTIKDMKSLLHNA